MYGADVTTFSGWGKAASGLPLRQCSRWSQRAHEHTSTRAHDTQPIPPQKNLTIRGNTSPAAAQKYVTNTHQDAPPSRAAPQKTPHPTPRLKRRQWARSSPQHTRKKDMPNPPPRRNRLATNQRAQTVVHYTPKTPCHPHSTEVDCTLSKHSGDFATIDPRHADDTPQRSAYGSNSPQTTNEHKPQRHQRHTTRHHTTSHHSKPKPPHADATAQPSNHSGSFATIDPRHADDTPQSSAYGSNSPQATNENKPHHHDKQTKTCRTRPTQPPKEHAALALPSNHAGGFATIDHRHAGDTPQGSAYGSNSPHRAQARPARIGT